MSKGPWRQGGKIPLHPGRFAQTFPEKPNGDPRSSRGYTNLAKENRRGFAKTSTKRSEANSRTSKGGGADIRYSDLHPTRFNTNLQRSKKCFTFLLLFKALMSLSEKQHEMNQNGRFRTKDNRKDRGSHPREPDCRRSGVQHDRPVGHHDQPVCMHSL